jgi:hypothetical protein
MTEVTEGHLDQLAKAGYTNEDVLGVIDKLAKEAKEGDADAIRLLHAVDFQQQLAKAMVDNVKTALRVLGTPVAPVECIAAAIASTLETIGLEVAPGIHKEFEDVRAELAASPQIIADRQKAQANLEARLKYRDKLKAEGLDREEITRKVGELYSSQLKDFQASNDAEEALAS